MTLAFVLITVKAGTDESVVQRLKTLPSVDDVHEIYGAYDIIAKILAASDDEIKDMVTVIASLENVRATETVRVSREWKKS